MLDQESHVNYQRGVASLVVLGLLKQSDMYGYQLIQEMERQSSGALYMKEGALYPVLYKLQDAGFISSQKLLVGKRMTRIYYHIEPSGIEFFERQLQAYQAVINGVLRITEGSGNEDAEESCGPEILAKSARITPLPSSGKGEHHGDAPAESDRVSG